jgi:acyl carrier protein
VNATEARGLLAQLIDRVAPGAPVSTMGDDETITVVLDLDSMDFLALVGELHDLTGLDVPERDYARLATPASFVAYVVEHT